MTSRAALKLDMQQTLLLVLLCSYLLCTEVYSLGIVSSKMGYRPLACSLSHSHTVVNMVAHCYPHSISNREQYNRSLMQPLLAASYNRHHNSGWDKEVRMISQQLELSEKLHRIVVSVCAFFASKLRVAGSRLQRWASVPLRAAFAMFPALIAVLLPTAATAAGRVSSAGAVERIEGRYEEGGRVAVEELLDEATLQREQRGELLNKVGLLLVGGSVVYVAATSSSGAAGSAKKKRRTRKPQEQQQQQPSKRKPAPRSNSSKIPSQRLRDEEDAIEEQLSRDPRRPNAQLQKQMKSLLLPKSAAELLAPGESIDDLFGDDDADDSVETSSVAAAATTATTAAAATAAAATTATTAATTVAPTALGTVEHTPPALGKRRGISVASPAAAAPVATAADSLEPSLPPYAAIIPAPEVSKMQSPPPTATAAASATATAAATPAAAVPPPPPPPPKKKPGVFGRLFQKPGSGRPAELSKAIRATGAAAEAAPAQLRSLIGCCLAAYAPPDAFPELADGGALAVDAFVNDDDDGDAAKDGSSSDAVRRLMQQLRVSEQQAADAFADVANAMIVRLVDQAASAADDSASLEEDREQAAVAALDVVSAFIGGAGAMFGACTPTASISPIEYNGRTKKSKLESLFQIYLKNRGRDFTNSFKQLLQGMGEDGTEQQQQQQSAVVTAAGEQLSEEEMADRVGKVQFLFDIKANKRSKIEQRIMRETMMNLGAGGEGSLEEMMSALSGGGQGGDLDAQMEELLKAAGGSGAAGAGGAGLDGMPDMSNMTQEEIAAVTQDAVASIKQSLAEGSISAEEIAEFEQMMGMDVKQLVKMLDKSGADKRKLAKQMGPEFAEMFDVFKQLAALKK